jgi:4,5-dihydroxyphthalate decarboxylase
LNERVQPARSGSAKVKLRFACGLYDRMLRLYTGDVKPEGIDLEFVAIDEPREIFDRMAGGLAFDMAEMSGSEYISRFGANQCPFVALPVFASRVFRHGFIFYNRRSGIRVPGDLAGKRIGVPLYTMSAALWARGLLQHEYGVDLSAVTWVQGALKAPGAHGSPSAMPLLEPVRLEINTSGKSLSRLLAEGEIDAVISSRTVEGLGTNPDIARLIPNYREVEKEYYKRTRIFPIMHIVVIRRDVYEAHPFVAQSMYDAFCASKAHALALMRELGALRYMLPWLTADIDEIDEVFGGDPWPYGVEANRPTLEAQIAYMVEQSFIPEAIPIETLFAPVVERS